MSKRIWRPTRDGEEDTYLFSVAGVDVARVPRGKTLVITYDHDREVTFRAFYDMSESLRVDIAASIRATHHLTDEQKDAVIASLHLTNAIPAN